METSDREAVMQQVGEMLSRPERVSRNRNFACFSGPQGKFALRLYRLLHKLGMELDQAAQSGGMAVTAESLNGDLHVVVEDPGRSYRRTSMVPAALAGHFHARLRGMGAWPPEGEAAS